MAEQFIKAYALRQQDLYELVGCKKQRMAERILLAAESTDVGELVEEAGPSLDELLGEVVNRKLKADNAYGYRRMLEVVAEVVGKPLSPEEIVLPGRGWQELGPAWRLWGQKRLAGVWGGARSGNRDFGWPWKRGKDLDWPVATLIPNDLLKPLRAELVTFSTDVVMESGVPKTIDRFSEADYWPLDDVASEIEHAHGALVQWLNQTIRARRDLLLWHDGQQ